MYEPSLDALRQRILLIRGRKVMLDADLAALYGVPTKALLQAVKRNPARFPDDFVFQLTDAEFILLRSQIVTFTILHRRYLPLCFTEQGVAMLSSVLRSERAVQVNIAIMRAFVHLREMIAGHAELRQRLDELEKKYDAQFKVVFDALRALMLPSAKSRKAIGFHAAEGRVAYRAVRAPMYEPSIDALHQSILLIRGRKVMLDADLAVLYGVPTKRLLEQVRRNASRFPDDFMFQLSETEFKLLRSQIATFTALNRKYLPYCFTEQGVAMLSSVLRSERAVQVNIAIMRAFVHLREMIAGHAELRQRLDELEKKYDAQFKVVFDAMRALMAPPTKSRKVIGFHAAEGRVAYRAARAPRKQRPQ